jgi:hypothetical protein
MYTSQKKNRFSLIGCLWHDRIRHILQRLDADLRIPNQIIGMHSTMSLKLPAAHQIEGLEAGPLLPQEVGVWRHGAGADAPYIGVMAAVGHKEDGLRSALVEHGRDDGEVGQVGAARLRMIRQNNVAAFQVRAQGAHLVPNSVLKRKSYFGNLLAFANKFAENITIVRILCVQRSYTQIKKLHIFFKGFAKPTKDVIIFAKIVKYVYSQERSFCFYSQISNFHGIRLIKPTKLPIPSLFRFKTIGLFKRLDLDPPWTKCCIQILILVGIVLKFSKHLACMAPRWTGICGALDTSPPSGPNSAQEKSSRSLMFVDIDVRCKIRPICSAIDMKRCEKMDS